MRTNYSSQLGQNYGAILIRTCNYCNRGW